MLAVAPTEVEDEDPGVAPHHQGDNETARHTAGFLFARLRALCGRYAEAQDRASRGRHNHANSSAIHIHARNPFAVIRNITVCDFEHRNLCAYGSFQMRLRD